MSTHTDRLARAAAYIDATQIAPQHWSYYDDNMGVRYAVSASDLAALCDYLDDPDPQIRRDAYSHWCAATEAAEVAP